MSVTVTLDAQELDLTAYVGQYRQMIAKAKGYHRPNIASVEDDQMAAAAEYVVAKARGMFWNALSETFKGLPDLSDGSEVKHARDPKHNLLIPGDTKRKIAWYYLVLGTPPTLTIYGRAWGYVAMSEKYWDENMPRPCWKVLKEDPAMHPFDIKNCVPGTQGIDWGD